MKKPISFHMLMLGPAPGQASDIVAVKRIRLELAAALAMKSVEACRKDGYNISTVVSGAPAVARTKAALKAVEERLEFAS